MTLRDHVNCYLALRRSIGYKLVTTGNMLKNYAEFAMCRGDVFVRAERAMEWSARGRTSLSLQNRLSTIRNFAIWLHAEDERHEVPSKRSLGPRTDAPYVPRLLTGAEIKQVMDAALSLGPRGSITPYTYHYIIGLIAATGLRRSEALRLRLTDVTRDGLVVRETKFRKSRLVPLHPNTRRALNRYLEIRQRTGGYDDHLFVLSTGRSPHPDSLTNMFVHLTREVGLRDNENERAPNLHGLRHRFAICSLENANATDDESVSRHMLALATYLGHVNMASTAWYLHATPTLLVQIAEAVENAHTWRIQ